MGSTLNNGDADYGDFHEITRQPFTVVCPQLAGTKPNLPQGACDERLAQRNISKCCRTCKGIGDVSKAKRKTVKRRGVADTTSSLILCGCGKVKAKFTTFCPECKAVKEQERQVDKRERSRKYYASEKKYCGICKEELANRSHNHCPKCKPFAKVEKNKRNVARQKESRKQNSVSKLCVFCKCELEIKKYKYCASCKIEAIRLQKIRNADKQRELRKQQREMK